jgi:chromate transporter
VNRPDADAEAGVDVDVDAEKQVGHAERTALAVGPNPERVASPAARDLVPFGEAVRIWFAISLQTFGGPAGQIAVMQRTLVEEKR